MEQKYWLAGASAVVAALVTLQGCSSEFRSCAASRTCAPGGSGGDAGANDSAGDDAGGSSPHTAGASATAGESDQGQAGAAGQGGEGGASEVAGCHSDADCAGITPVCSPSGACAVRPSCQGLPATCGKDGNGDCCASNVVPGGTFLRSFDGVSYTDNTNPATVSTFKLDKYEITVGRFRKFVAAYRQDIVPAGDGRNPNNPDDEGWDTSWNGKLPPDSKSLIEDIKGSPDYSPWLQDNENLPMSRMTWYEAEAFCIWDHGRLPTEAEWSYAAAGGSDQRLYPWGNAQPGANAELAVYGCYYHGTGTCTGVENFAPVGSIPAGDGKWGQSDLAGNIDEWVQDGIDDITAPYIKPCVNCAGARKLRTIYRGGWNSGPDTALLVSHRSYDYGESSYTGARCARTAD